MMPLISQQEIQAHLVLAQVLQRRVKREVPRVYMETVFWRTVGVFAPRCNCGLVLTVTRLPSHNVVQCGGCGHRNEEHALNA